MSFICHCRYLADRVIVFDGTPSIDTRACAPQSLLTGMNRDGLYKDRSSRKTDSQ